MPLPALRADGTLPPGLHHATLDEILAAFPPATPERQALTNALAFCIANIQRHHLADQVVLGGNYVTRTPNPGDVDIAVLTPGIYQMAGEQRYAALGIDTTLLDIQFAHDATDFQGWIAFFSTARDLTLKGVVSLLY